MFWKECPSQSAADCRPETAAADQKHVVGVANQEHRARGDRERRGAPRSRPRAMTGSSCKAWKAAVGINTATAGRISISTDREQFSMTIT